jgi:hypothetical protein
MRGVMGAVIAPCVVLGALSLRCMGVVAAIITPHGVSSRRVVLGPGGPSREWVVVYIGMKDLAAKEEVSKQKKRKRNEKSYRQ